MRAENPVFRKELRTFMRERRAFLILGAYLAVLSLTLFFMLLVTAGEGGRAWHMRDIGKDIFWVVSFIQLTLVTLISPSFACGAIVGEKEQKTFDFLRLTLLRPGSIVMGKLCSSLSFSFLLVVSSLPIVSICFVLGGVSPEEVIVVYALILISAFTLGSLALLLSSLYARTGIAVLCTYVITLIIHGGAVITVAVIYMSESIYGSRPEATCLKVFGSLVPRRNAVARIRR